jgi:divalent metal cation (Fe/Co/Zn/Cd) transporter
MTSKQALLRRGFRLEYVTLAWNVVGVIILAYAAIRAHSVALAGFGLDSLVEIGASFVVVWELANINPERQRRALKLIGWAFMVLATYILVQSVVVLVSGYRPHHSGLGIAWTAVTLIAMLALAYGKARTGQALNNPVLQTEGRVTLVDAYLAGAVLLGLIANVAWGWWWADPLAGLVIVFYGYKEAWRALRA